MTAESPSVKKPRCFGTYEEIPDCRKCGMGTICRATTAKAQKRSERKSVLTEKIQKIVELPGVLAQFAIEVAEFVVDSPRRARAMRAFCWTCDQYRGCCGAPACPLYHWRRHKNFPALCWWMKSRDTWEVGYGSAMDLESRMIRAFDADRKERESANEEAEQKETGGAVRRSKGKDRRRS